MGLKRQQKKRSKEAEAARWNAYLRLLEVRLQRNDVDGKDTFIRWQTGEIVDLAGEPIEMLSADVIRGCCWGERGIAMGFSLTRNDPSVLLDEDTSPDFWAWYQATLWAAHTGLLWKDPEHKSDDRSDL